MKLNLKLRIRRPYGPWVEYTHDLRKVNYKNFYTLFFEKIFITVIAYIGVLDVGQHVPLSVMLFRIERQGTFGAA